MISRRGFLGGLLGAAAACALPLKWAYSKIKFRDVYCDSDKGNDQNDGYSADTPVQTLQAAVDRLPTYCPSGATIRLKGTFEWDDVAKNTRVYLERGSSLIMDGGGWYSPPLKGGFNEALPGSARVTHVVRS